VLGAFRSFMKQIKAAYPYLYRQGDFEPLADMFTDLSNETSSAGIRVSDMAVELTRKGSLTERMFFLDRLVKDLRELGSPQAVCQQWIDPFLPGGGPRH